MLRQLAWRGAARLRAPFPRQPLPAAALDSLERLGYAVVPGWLRAADTAALLADALALEAAGVPRAAVDWAASQRARALIGRSSSRPS